MLVSKCSKGLKNQEQRLLDINLYRELVKGNTYQLRGSP